jgi:PAS domain S-box-containing protein
MTHRPLRYLAGVFVLATVYFGAAKLGLSLATVAEQVTVVWPPSGIALAALLLFGYRLWPGIALGAFLANATAHETVPVACGIALGNTLEAVVGTWLLHRFVGFRTSLERLKDVLGLLALAASVSTTVSATVGVTSLCLGGIQPWSLYGSLWWTWWLGDAMGDIVMAPALLTWAAWPLIDWRPRRTAEAAAVLLGLVAVGLAVFKGGALRSAPSYPLEYTIFPFVIWAALRFGQRGSTTVTLVALAIAVLGTANSSGPFAGRTAQESLVLLDFYMAVVAVTALLLAATMTERRMSERRRAIGHAVTAVLAESPSLAEAARRLLQETCRRLDWDVGTIWCADRWAQVLHCVEVWHRPSVKVVEFEATTRRSAFAPGVGLPGRVWSSGQAIWIADVAKDTNFPRAPIATQEGLHGAFGFPILLGTEILGALEFFSRHIQRPDEDLLQTLAAIGGQIGQFIERKRAEEALRRREQELTDFLENATLGLHWVGPDGTILWVNRAELELLGYARDEYIGHNIAEFHVDQEAIDDILTRLGQGETLHNCEAQLRCKDGTVRHVLMSANVYFEEGKFVHTRCFTRDITDRKRSEQASQFLADAGAALASLVEPDSTLQQVALLAVPAFADWCIVDMAQEDGSLRRVTVAHADPVKRELAQDLARKYPPDPDWPHGPLHVLRTGQAERLEEIPDVLLVEAAQDEEHLRILRELAVKSYLGVPLRVRGKAVGVVSFVAAESGRRYDGRDLAVAEELARRVAIALENAHLYSEVREAARRKDEFLAMLAHELRNPLAPIRNAVQILKMPGADRSTVERARAMMERQVQHLVRLVDDLLDVSRIMRGKIELRRERIDLAVVVARAVETAYPAIGASGHKLKVALPPEPIMLEADPIRLAQAIANLLNNAAKYTEREGHIGIAAEQVGDEAIVRVQDTGIGIATEMLPRIFDLFVQADRSRDRAQGGMGIGLTLVRSLVQMHGGTVRAYSGGMGKGSEFVLRLPALPRARRPEVMPKQVDGCPPDHHARRRILVVDDNVDAAESLAMLLRLEGQDVRVAHDGAAALKAVQAEVPELVFLDLGMPGMDGYEVARRLRQQPALQKIVLVALTGWGQEEDRRRTKEAGFDQHLVKPVEPGQLHQLLGESR